jgi:protein-L-isoaspartate(D-aspartate) O-methyltransferase
MATIPRHLFVPEADRQRAYDDNPLPIGGGQTISQPFIVAYMTEAIRPQPGHRVLEVGTGSGYQTAVLASVVKEVYSVEIRPDLADAARARLAEMGVRNVSIRLDDGARGWPEAAPFDSVIVTAAPESIPMGLLAQLRPGGLMIVPLGMQGPDHQQLVRLKRTRDSAESEVLLPVRFVPFTSEDPRPH